MRSPTLRDSTSMGDPLPWKLAQRVDIGRAAAVPGGDPWVSGPAGGPVRAAAGPRRRHPEPARPAAEIQHCRPRKYRALFRPRCRGSFRRDPFCTRHTAASSPAFLPPPFTATAVPRSRPVEDAFSQPLSSPALVTDLAAEAGREPGARFFPTAAELHRGPRLVRQSGPELLDCKRRAATGLSRPCRRRRAGIRFPLPVPAECRDVPPPLVRSDIPGLPVRRGKVRDCYDLGDGRLVLVATDRLSAFDWVLPTPIPDKGRILTRLSLFWFRLLADVPNHVLGTDLAEMGPEFVRRRDELEGRTLLVRKARVVPVECVARGYLAGSGWEEYRKGGAVCGVPLPPGLRQAERLPQPIFTPATKEESGHDQNISFERMADLVGAELAAELRRRTLDVYRRAADFAAGRGILLADTKLEWGHDADGRLLLVDEVLTPDSSRFWPADGYQVGEGPPSFDKQFVRDWLSATTWDKNSPPPELPPHVVERTRARYVEAFERLTGRPFDA